MSTVQNKATVRGFCESSPLRTFAVPSFAQRYRRSTDLGWDALGHQRHECCNCEMFGEIGLCISTLKSKLFRPPWAMVPSLPT